jgi:hypothetical protein
MHCVPNLHGNHKVWQEANKKATKAREMSSTESQYTLGGPFGKEDSKFRISKSKFFLTK